MTRGKEKGLKNSLFSGIGNTQFDVKLYIGVITTCNYVLPATIQYLILKPGVSTCRESSSYIEMDIFLQ